MRIQRYDNSFMQLSISAWITSRYNSHHNFLSSTERDRVRFLLFCSIWTTLLSPIFPVLLSLESLEMLSSVAAHLVLFVLLIIPLISLMIAPPQLVRIVGVLALRGSGYHAVSQWGA